MFHSAQDWDVVMRAPLFKAMGPAIARAMIGDRQPRTYARGEQLFAQGDPADGFFCVIGGWVKLYRLSEDGEEVVVHVFSAGETFAEVAMFSGGRFPASCEAVSAARILGSTRPHLRRAVLDEPQLAFDMLAAVSPAPAHAGRPDRAAERPLGAAAHRRLLRPAIRRAAGPVRLALPYEKALIASRLG